MTFDVIQGQRLQKNKVSASTVIICNYIIAEMQCQVGAELTSRIASLDRAPGKSCLLAKTSSVAPANLCKERSAAYLKIA